MKFISDVLAIVAGVLIAVVILSVLWNVPIEYGKMTKECEAKGGVLIQSHCVKVVE